MLRMGSRLVRPERADTGVGNNHRPIFCGQERVAPDGVRLLGLRRIIRLLRVDGGRGAAWIRQALLPTFAQPTGGVVDPSE